jgi:hypothetical protein
VVIATHNEGLVGRFSHRQLRIGNGTVRLVVPNADGAGADAAALEAGAPATEPAADSRAAAEPPAESPAEPQEASA